MKNAFFGIVAALAFLSSSFAEVQVVYFHGKQRCPTCRAIESETKSVMDEYFRKEIKERRLSFKVVDISDAKNEKIAEDFRVSWSSLFIVSNDGRRENLTALSFANARRNPAEFKIKLRNAISERLK